MAQTRRRLLILGLTLPLIGGAPGVASADVDMWDFAFGAAGLAAGATGGYMAGKRKGSSGSSGGKETIVIQEKVRAPTSDEINKAKEDKAFQERTARERAKHDRAHQQRLAKAKANAPAGVRAIVKSWTALPNAERGRFLKAFDAALRPSPAGATVLTGQAAKVSARDFAERFIKATEVRARMTVKGQGGRTFESYNLAPLSKLGRLFDQVLSKQHVKVERNGSRVRITSAGTSRQGHPAHLVLDWDATTQQGRLLAAGETSFGSRYRDGYGTGIVSVKITKKGVNVRTLAADGRDKVTEKLTHLRRGDSPLVSKLSRTLHTPHPEMPGLYPTRTVNERRTFQRFKYDYDYRGEARPKDLTRQQFREAAHPKLKTARVARERAAYKALPLGKKVGYQVRRVMQRLRPARR
jgi:hypothetical protein